MRIIRPAHLNYILLLAIMLGGGVAFVGAKTVPYGAWLGLIPVLVIAYTGLRRPVRRWQLARTSFPEDWRRWLEAQVPFYHSLDAPGRKHFERDVLFYLEDQRFEGVGDQKVTDVLRLSVAAGAAVLLHGRPDWELSTKRTVLFYPGRFDEDYHDTYAADYEGMVHPQGPVLFSAEAVEEGWRYPHDGHNVVLHELAHLFDFDNAFADGTPSLMDPASAEAWKRLVQREMRRARMGKSLLRRYAGTNPAEFFAVAVENYFERPRLLQQRHPRLFEALEAFFNG